MSDFAWAEGLSRTIAAEGPVVRILVIRADGSTPREEGTAMLVSGQALHGTIGGGALEFDAIARAREMLDSAGKAGAWHRSVRHYPLGPALGQCCGGHVRVLFELLTGAEAEWIDDLPETDAGAVVRPVADGAAPAFAADRKADGSWPLAVTKVLREMLSGRRPAALALVPGRRGSADWVIEPRATAKIPLFLYGAGHVGRALVRVLQGLPFDLTWVDTDRTRFPDAIPAHASPLVAVDPTAAATNAPVDAIHIVMTFSHAIDLAICHAVLARGDFLHLGLIGSATKRARFETRLTEMGISRAGLDRLVCPIGLEAVTSKEPAAIAVSVAADLMRRFAERGMEQDAPVSELVVDERLKGGDAG